MPTTLPKINRDHFFSSIRPVLFAGKLSQPQVSGISAILDEWERRGLDDLRWLAYIMATCMHESAATFEAIEEYGKGKGKAYGGKLKIGAGPGKRIPYDTPDKLYFGRGLVQISWYDNYEKLGKLLGIDLLQHPELALQLDVAVKITFEGMTKGIFTGRKLSHYFNDTQTDWVNARKIINSLDQAVKIAGYAASFHKSLFS